MSIYTEHEKIKSLWHPITDDDFNIDWSKAVILFSSEGSLLLYYPLLDTPDEYFDGVQLFCEDGKTMTDEFKQYIRETIFGYMYVDDEFSDAVKDYKFYDLDLAKTATERPYLFVAYRSGLMDALSFFDFRQDGEPYNRDIRQQALYFVNLRSVPATNPDVLFVKISNVEP